nr:RNA-directed DNA polymerase, eukaryota, reverse transcriptase zinc-binding domain protein [Tanacetum cinerariifolium]
MEQKEYERYKVRSEVINSIQEIDKLHSIEMAQKAKIKWDSVLAPKDKGWLGVSSLYALNRTLMLKWVWRFYCQSSTLWTRVMKAIHGEDEKIADQTLAASLRRKPRGGIKDAELLDLMQTVTLSLISDWWIWTLEGSGDFSV